MNENLISKGERTQAAIIAAAYDLFVQQGYHGTSMRQIAQKADLALGGIYNHFANKEEIFKAVVIAYHPFVTVMPILVQVQGDSAEELLREAAIRLATELERQEGLFRLMFTEMIELNGRHMPELVKVVLPHLLQFQQRVAAMPGQFRTRSPVTFFRTFIGTILVYVIMNEMLTGTTVLEPEPTSIDDMMDIYLHGLITENDA